MGRAFDITPRETTSIETKYRRIATKLPVPESVPILERLRKYEPISMTGQPPVMGQDPLPGPLTLIYEASLRRVTR